MYQQRYSHNDGPRPGGASPRGARGPAGAGSSRTPGALQNLGSSGRPRFSRPQFSRSRSGGSRGGSGGGRIDHSKFINKAVITEAQDVFVPEHTFADFPVSESLKVAITEKGYVLPTPIQDKAIPHVLKGQDVVGIANTGTGKTAAFLIPLIDKVLKDEKAQVLVIVPTRELALQIDSEFKGFARKMRLFSVCVVGGAPIGPQLRALSYRNQFVIGTPGRLKDLVERGKIRLSDYSTIVLDEADRMLDMGFIDDMRYVMKGMPKVRHTLFFSATLSREIEGLIAEFLNNPVFIKVVTRETAQNVEQDIVKVGREEKINTLHNLLNQEDFKKVLVFGRTKHGVEKLSRALHALGVKTQSIHGDKSHRERQRALGLFKDNLVQVLVATDVAARGLDIKDISHVINFDLPTNYEDYVHRIGRTGRGTKRGKALTFVE